MISEDLKYFFNVEAILAIIPSFLNNCGVQATVLEWNRSLKTKSQAISWKII
jgi:hypothetical protein